MPNYILGHLHHEDYKGHTILIHRDTGHHFVQLNDPNGNPLHDDQCPKFHHERLARWFVDTLLERRRIEAEIASPLPPPGEQPLEPAY